MKQRTKIITFASIAIPILSAAPAVLAFTFPNAFLKFLELNVLWCIPLLYTFLLQKKQTQEINAQTFKKISFWKAIGNTFFVQATFLMIFFGIVGVFFQYNFKPHQQPIINTAILSNTLPHFFDAFVFFPGAFIALNITLFHSHASRNKWSLTHRVFIPIKNLKTLIQRTLDIYYIVATRLIIVTAIMAFGLIILKLTYPTFNLFQSVLLGFTTSMLLLALTNIQFFERVSVQFEKIQPKASVWLSINLFLTTLVLLGCSFIGHYLVNHNKKLIALWKPLVFIHLSQLPLMFGIFCFSWWLLATPSISSMLYSKMEKRYLWQAMLISLLLPLICSIASIYWHQTIIHWLFLTPIPGYTIFGIIGMVCLLLLLSHRRANTYLRIGYWPQRPVWKDRILAPKQIMLLVALCLTMYALTGIIALSVIISIYTIGIMLCSLLMLFNIQEKPKNN